MRVIVTGGAGFIGGAVCRLLVGRAGYEVLNIDRLTYAASLAALRDVEGAPNYRFLRADVCDAAAMTDAFATFRPDAVMHLAAESHVDRSIDGAAPFVSTNIVGTYTLLEAARAHWQSLPPADRDRFRFHHVSTDEVYGSLGPEGAFSETSPYDPSSPYSASKAAADHLVAAWGRTYGLPCVVSNCSNNYGPYQFPEKLIPLAVLNALHGKPIPVYGTGANVRDWLHVEDHAAALHAVLTRGAIGAKYLVGGRAERRNIEVVRTLCAILDRLVPDGRPHERLISFVTDRPGHDARYAVDPSRIESELGWRPRHGFEAGLEATVAWYVANEWWWRPLRDRVYAGERLGRAGSGRDGRV